MSEKSAATTRNGQKSLVLKVKEYVILQKLLKNRLSVGPSTALTSWNGPIVMDLTFLISLLQQRGIDVCEAEPQR